jgi:hypothetical protein
MGRIEKSQGLAPPAIRKDIRAKQARHIVNKVVPSILASNARAKRGTESSEVIADPGPAFSNNVHLKDVGGEDAAYVKCKGQGRRKAKAGQEMDDEDTGPSKGKMKKSVKRRNDSINEDMSTLSLNPEATAPPERKDHTTRIITTDSLTAAQIMASNRAKQAKRSENVCVLNMASPLRPGAFWRARRHKKNFSAHAPRCFLPSKKSSIAFLNSAASSPRMSLSSAPQVPLVITPASWEQANGTGLM